MLAEALLVVIVITMGSSLIQQDVLGPSVEVVRFKAVDQQEQEDPAPEEAEQEEVQEEVPEEAKEEEAPEVEPTPPPEEVAPEEPEPEPEPEPEAPQPKPTPKEVIPLEPKQVASADITPRAKPDAQPAAPPSAPKGQKFGPPDQVGTPRDSARVGTGPRGEPLYAAAWYREPYPDELRGYLSTATGPGWGLIACRTAPDFRVEDCMALDEYPKGSNINRALLAAAWQFHVRPPRVGGEPRIGEWVRIRITYGVEKR